MLATSIKLQVICVLLQSSGIHFCMSSLPWFNFVKLLSLPVLWQWLDFAVGSFLFVLNVPCGIYLHVHLDSVPTDLADFLRRASLHNIEVNCTSSIASSFSCSMVAYLFSVACLCFCCSRFIELLRPVHAMSRDRSFVAIFFKFYGSPIRTLIIRRHL